MSVIRSRRHPPRRKRNAPAPGVKRGRRYPADPTLNWTGKNAEKYARRFVFTPEQLDAHWKRNYSREGRRFYAEEALAFEDRSARILEVGCNTGNQMALLRSMGFTNLQGAEIFAPAAAAARRRGFPVAEADARRLPFEDGSFDLAMTCWCLCHIAEDQWRKALEELLRVAPACFITEPAAPQVPMGDRPPFRLSDRDWSKPGYLWCRDIYTELRRREDLRITYIQWCGLPGRVATQMIVARKRNVPVQ